MASLLLEIGTEEIPAKFMPAALAELKTLAQEKLAAERLNFSAAHSYGTPRRLALIVDDLASEQQSSTLEVRGPSVAAAYRDNAPSAAALGFAAKQGVAVTDLVSRDNYVYAVKRRAGLKTQELLPALLAELVQALNFPKTMRWGDLDFRFARPLRWLAALYGAEVVDFTLAGVTSSRKTRGHRFLRGESTDEAGEITLKDAASYLATLRANFVMADQDERRAQIRRQVQALALAEGGTAAIDAELLEEVTYLVEWPTALCGNFDASYLELPAECVITPMREHQRYFPVLKADGGLLNKFITVRNGSAEHLAQVTHGNERVLRARLADAQFFFDEDRKEPLAARGEKLRSVAFQEGLGTMYDKSQRLAQAAKMLAFALNAAVDAALLERAALLAKCDLVSAMVVEFTELQGVMGRAYALLDGEAPAVAEAIYEHYLPRFSEDALPQSTLGQILSLADKFDNIVASFSRGLAPTGSQDPYALRRQALGIINILIKGGLHLGLAKTLGGFCYLLNLPPEATGKLLPELLDFFRQRLKNLLLEEGIRYDVADAVLKERRNDDPADLAARARALNAFLTQPGAAEFIQAATRVQNLAKKQQQPAAINEQLLAAPEEKELYAALEAANTQVLAAAIKRDYAGVLTNALSLVQPINRFFEAVLVMDKDEKVQQNRLALLAAVEDVTNNIGDLSAIVN